MRTREAQSLVKSRGGHGEHGNWDPIRGQAERRRSVLAQSIVSGPVKSRPVGRSSEMNIQYNSSYSILVQSMKQQDTEQQ